MAAVTTGNSNTALGWQALAVNTDGVNNTAVGTAALNSAVSTNGNTALGLGAMQNLTAGDNNVAVGNGTMGTASGGTHTLYTYAYYSLDDSAFLAPVSVPDYEKKVFYITIENTNQNAVAVLSLSMIDKTVTNLNLSFLVPFFFKCQ